MTGWSPRIVGADDTATNDNGGTVDRDWAARAVEILDEERRRAEDTPLIRLDCPELPAIEIHIKDETRHPSGSLKHRLAHALFVHAICNGEIGPDTMVVEASSGSTAISEAWFARRLGLRFVAVVPDTIAPAKIAAIREAGATVETVCADVDICAYAERLAWRCDGHFMNQFGRAAEVTDWRGVNNIAESLFAQIAKLPSKRPDWVVVGAGTGGTSSTIGRYVRLQPELKRTRLCVVDPEGSALFAAYCSGDANVRGRTSPIVEGIGRPSVGPGFNPRLIDHMLSIADVASVAGAHWLKERTGRMFGPSTGTNIIGVLLIAQGLERRGIGGSIVTLACDRGERYAETIYDPAWLAAQKLDVTPWQALLAKLDAFVFPDGFG